MKLEPVQTADLARVADLVNAAYRGLGATPGWTHEAEALEGRRTTADMLQSDIAAKPAAHLLVHREGGTGELLACVWLEPYAPTGWYLGMLSIRPDRQNEKLGRRLLDAAHDFVAARGAEVVRIHVINIRDSLIDWYGRRGYVRTGEEPPFPYGDNRFGAPLRGDMRFVVMQKAL